MSQDYGKHYLVEYAQCNADKLRKVEDVEPLLLEAAKRSGATILGKIFHQFEPEGVTGIILIAESHFSIHTWPETGFVAFDVLTCGEMDAQKAVDFLKDEFEAGVVKLREFRRGIDG